VQAEDIFKTYFLVIELPAHQYSLTEDADLFNIVYNKKLLPATFVTCFLA